MPPPDGWEQGRRPPRQPAWLPAQRDPDRFLDIPRAVARETGRPWTVPEPAPPPEVLRAFRDLGPGGNWEGGTVDRAGRRWVHEPYTGWRRARPGHVYTAARVRRARRRETVARPVAAAGLLASLALLYVALVAMSVPLAIAGATLAAVVGALIRWGLSGGRPR